MKPTLLKTLVYAFMMLILSNARAQNLEMKMGKVRFSDLEMKTYPKDTTAGAVVLNELGQAHISDDSEGGLVFEHYLKIKILNRRGFDQANIEFPLFKGDKSSESLIEVIASTFNIENGVKKETKLDSKKVFKADEKNYVMVKFALPDIREGSVMEIKYSIRSPFIFNFRHWDFQSDIPKIHSEYWALIPTNYVYNIALRGYYKLKKNESELISDCFDPGGGLAMVDCALFKYAMDDVPAFFGEDYMTAEMNFISAVYFELSEVRRFNGSVDKVTKEWKDVDLELKQSNDFGQQIRKAGNLLEDKVKELTGAETDELKKAKLIYNFIKDSYTWNGDYGKYTDEGVKKAFELRKGNVADINLTLVGALQSAGLNASPVILSTRDNGLPIELFPVMSNFNYVTGSVDIADKRYLLDATDPLQPFGFLPMRCLNGKGRLMAKESTWTDLTPKDKRKTVTLLELTLTKDGGFEGKASINYQGYAAFSKRSEIQDAHEIDECKKKLQENLKEIEITNYQIENLTALDMPLFEKMDLKWNAGPGGGSETVFLNPFIFDRIDKNPFKSSERLYPVDFGAPLESVLTLNLQFGPDYEVDELPTPVALTMQQGGGRFLLSATKFTNRVSFTSNLTVNRAVYNSGEYAVLKELFARVVQANQAQIVLKHK